MKEEHQESEQKRKESLLKKRRHEDKDDDDYQAPLPSASEGEKKKRGRKPGQKNGMGKAALEKKGSAQQSIQISINKRSSLNPEEHSEKEGAKEDP